MLLDILSVLLYAPYPPRRAALLKERLGSLAAPVASTWQAGPAVKIYLGLLGMVIHLAIVVVGKHVSHFCLLWFSGKSPLNC